MRGRSEIQLALVLEKPRRGGKREGAGRKPGKGKRQTPHRARPELRKNEVVHVVLRVDGAVGRLRRRAAYAAVRRAVATTMARQDFRIVHVSIQHNHIHLLVEASGKSALARGTRAFMISAAQRLNQACDRKGKVFIDRYHATLIRSPRRARNALAYVLNNWRRHKEHLAGAAQQKAHVDPYSSAILFDGWAEFDGRFAIPPTYEPLPVAGARSWLLNVGWREHHPRIKLREVPGPI